MSAVNLLAEHLERAPARAEVLPGWRAIGDHLGVPPEIAMRWHLEHRLPIQVLTGAKPRDRRVVASRAPIDAWRAEHPALTPPLPRLMAKRLLRRELFPDLASWAPPEIADWIGLGEEKSRKSYRDRWNNMIARAPLLTARQKGIAHAFAVEARPHPDGRWLVRYLSVEELARIWQCDERTVQRCAREVAGPLKCEETFRHPEGAARRRPKDWTCNEYHLVITLEVLRALGYAITVGLAAAIADVDPAAAAFARSGGAKTPPAPARPPQGQGRPRAPSTPPKAPDAASEPRVALSDVARELLLELQAAKPVAHLPPEELSALAAELDELRELVHPPRTGLQAMQLIRHQARSKPNATAEDMIGRLRNFMETQKGVTDAQILQGSLARSAALRPAVQDPDFVERVLKVQRTREIPFFGVEGLLARVRSAEPNAPTERALLQLHILAHVRGGEEPAVAGTAPAAPTPEPRRVRGPHAVDPALQAELDKGAARAGGSGPGPPRPK